MEQEETATIVRLVKSVFPQQPIDATTYETWHLVIGELDFGAAQAAVISIAHSQSFCAAADVIREARRVRGMPYDRTAADAIGMANQRALNAQGASSAVGALWSEALARGRRENDQRRTRVLKHPDLAALLCQPPLPWTSPEHWNGFVPPRFLPSDASGNVRPNDSPERAVLVEICTEAARRELEAAP